jgi:hypothetical protein
LRKQLFRYPLDHLRIALAKRLASRKIKRGVCAFFEPEQALLHGWRELSCAKRKRGGFVVEGIDDVALRAAEPVVQGEEGGGVDLRHGAVFLA